MADHEEYRVRLNEVRMILLDVRNKLVPISNYIDENEDSFTKLSAYGQLIRNVADAVDKLDILTM